MKLICFKSRSRRSERGSAVVVVLAMVGIMLVCVGSEVAALRHLKREMKLIERKQQQRLQPEHPANRSAGHARPNPAKP